MIHIEDVSPVRTRTTIGIGGQSPSGRVMRIAASPDKRRLYAGTAAGVWRSDDGGDHWRQMFWPQPPPGTDAVPGSLPAPNVLSIWVSPANPDVVLAGVGHDGRTVPQNGIYRSVNGGATWSLVHTFPPTSRVCTQIASAPDPQSPIVAAGEASIAISTDGGASFVDRFPWAPSFGSAYHVAVAPLDGPMRRMYALGGGQMWVSLDGGTTWRRDFATVSVVGGAPDGRGSGGEPGEFAATNSAPVHVVVPRHPARLYVAGTDRSLWAVDYADFAATGQGAWTALPVPPGGRSSGRFYVIAQPLPFERHLLFYSDSDKVWVCSAPPQAPESWQPIDPNHLVHVDPHCLAVSPDYVARVDPDGIAHGGGTLWVSNDGGVYRSEDSGATWTLGVCLSVLAPLNVTAAAARGQTALCIGTGDNIGFYSTDGGQHWKSQDYIGGDNDCCFLDQRQPSRLLVFAPRDGPTIPLRLYVDPGGGVPDAAIGTSQVLKIFGPPGLTNSQGKKIDNWNAVSFYVFKGHRPLVLTLAGEEPRPDGDFAGIRFFADGTKVVVRTTAMSTITAPEDWNTTATDEGPGVKVFQQGPVLPSPNAIVLQASGGHASPTFYVRAPADGAIWKWTRGMTDWQPVVPAAQPGPQFALGMFVDPYRPSRVYVIDDPTGAIHRSDNGGLTWVRDESLTQAVTEHDTFRIPLVDTFYNTESIVIDMLFDPEDPGRIFAVGYAGAFFTTDGVRWGRMMSSTALPQHAQMATLDTHSDPCNNALYIATGGRGVLRLRPLPWPVRTVNVTRITGRRITGPVTSWQTPNGPMTVEHLAARDPAGHLLVFWWSPAHDWQVVDVTAKTGRTIDGPLTSWQTRNGPFLVEHLAARDSNGHLLVFWWSPAHDWQVLDITAITGRTIVSGVTSWQTPNGPENVEHLAGHDAGGRLLVFWWTPSHDWRVVDISAITGQRVMSTPTSWQTANGPLNVEHLAAHGVTGDLLVFYWAPTHDWQVVNVSGITGVKIGGPPTSWQTPNGPFNVEHLAAAGADGRLRVFFWSPQHDWQSVDVTARTGISVAGAIGSWQTRRCRPVNFEHLAANDVNGALQIFTWSPENDWYAADVSELTGTNLQTGVTAWQTPNGPFNVEHLAAPDLSGNLIVFATRGSEVLTGRSDGPHACQP
jgi:photosystem II stability/assembly factor-like uncharacterized protein